MHGQSERNVLQIKIISRKSQKLKKMTYPLYRYSNLFLNAYLNRIIHAEYLKRIEFYSPLGILHVFLYSINTNKNEITYRIHC